MDPTNPTQNGADPAAEVVPGAIDPATATDPANGGVTPPAVDPAKDPAKDSSQMIPKDRFDEVIGERNGLRSQVETLSQQVTSLTEIVQKHQSGAVTTPREQDKAQSALDDLIAEGQITKPEAQKLQRIVDAMGYRRGEPTDPNASKVTELEKKVDFLTNKLSSDADMKQKESALKKFEGVVTEQELDAEMKKMANSKDPEDREMVKSASYSTIIKVRFHDKIVQRDVDAALKVAPKNAPKIEPGKSTPTRTPEVKEIKYDPKDPKAYERALKAEMKAKLHEKGN